MSYTDGQGDGKRFHVLPRHPSRMPHHCHARGCAKLVRPELLMCLAHWRDVPRRIQQAVWRHYRVGQCDDKRPSQAWQQAADAAIGFVAAKHGKPISKLEWDALQAMGYEVELNRAGETGSLLVRVTEKR